MTPLKSGNGSVASCCSPRGHITLHISGSAANEAGKINDTDILFVFVLVWTAGLSMREDHLLISLHFNGNQTLPDIICPLVDCAPLTRGEKRRGKQTQSLKFLEKYHCLKIVQGLGTGDVH